MDSPINVPNMSMKNLLSRKKVQSSNIQLSFSQTTTLHKNLYWLATWTPCERQNDLKEFFNYTLKPNQTRDSSLNAEWILLRVLDMGFGFGLVSGFKLSAQINFSQKKKKYPKLCLDTSRANNGRPFNYPLTPIMTSLTPHQTIKQHSQLLPSQA